MTTKTYVVARSDVLDTIDVSSTLPVQSAAIKTALDGKVNTESGKGLSSNDYTTEEKTKLTGLNAIYQHLIHITTTDYNINCMVVTGSNTAFTADTFAQYLTSNGLTGSNYTDQCLIANGIHTPVASAMVYGITYDSSASKLNVFSNTYGTASVSNQDITAFNDIVIACA